SADDTRVESRLHPRGLREQCDHQKYSHRFVSIVILCIYRLFRNRIPPISTMNRIQQPTVIAAQIAMRTAVEVLSLRDAARHAPAPPKPMAPGIAPPSVRIGMIPQPMTNSHAQIGIGPFPPGAFRFARSACFEA